MSDKLCINCVSVEVCTHNIRITQAISRLDTNIRYPAGDISDHYFNDQITRDLKTLKERALKLTGKHCRYFKSVK
ncbi:hypothetical protein KAR91_51750 [Candidatus Pacearchaeota archaeon]|nr:hypothetical protein [Candidatus Pacearchaeota archaeon]